MKRKKFFLCNPILIGVAAIILFLLSIFLDMLIDIPKRPYYLEPTGMSFYALFCIVLDFSYTWLFLGKLAQQFPEQGDMIIAVRQMSVIPTKKHKMQLKEMQITSKNTVSYFGDGSLEFRRIDSEWRTGLKWLAFAMLCLLLIPPVELIIWDWMDATRPTILNYLNSIAK